MADINDSRGVIDSRCPDIVSGSSLVSKAITVWKNSDRLQKLLAMRLALSGAFVGIIVVGAVSRSTSGSVNEVYQVIGAAVGFLFTIGFKLHYIK